MCLVTAEFRQLSIEHYINQLYIVLIHKYDNTSTFFIALCSVLHLSNVPQSSKDENFVCSPSMCPEKCCQGDNSSISHVFTTEQMVDVVCLYSTTWQWEIESDSVSNPSSPLADQCYQSCSCNKLFSWDNCCRRTHNSLLFSTPLGNNLDPDLILIL